MKKRSRAPDRGVAGAALVWERFVDKAILKVQQRMFTPITEQALQQFAQLLTVPLYREVVEERAAGRLCGYPACSEPIAHDYTGKMRISVTTRSLYSLEALNEFCSEACLVHSTKFERALSAESVYGRANLVPMLRTLFPALTEVCAFPCVRGSTPSHLRRQDLVQSSTGAASVNLLSTKSAALFVELLFTACCGVLRHGLLRVVPMRVR